MEASDVSIKKKLEFIFGLARLWNKTAVDYANSNERSRLQDAAVRLLATSYAIAFAIEDLQKGFHLFAAELLQRPLLERIGVLNFLQFGGDAALDVWERGWLHNDRERPNLQKLLEAIPELSTKPDNASSELTPAEFRKITINRLHSVVHADPIGALRTLKPSVIPETYAFISGPMMGHPERATEVETLTFVLVDALIKATERAFPSARWPMQEAAKLLSETRSKRAEETHG